MKKLLEICTSETHFLFNGQVYQQVDGIAMGSPLGPLFADIYVNQLEDDLRPQLEQQGLIYWKRFVDDSLAIIHKDTNIDTMINTLNSYNKNIAFTYEEEKNNTIPFLDILIRRNTSKSNTLQRNTFSTEVYRKPTYTGLLLKWESFVPKSYKASAISSMAYRAIRISSSYQIMHEEFNFIKRIATQNGYPLRFVESHIRNTLGRYLDKENKTEFFQNKTKKDTNQKEKNKKQIFVDIPYVGKPSEMLGKRLIRLASELNPNIVVQPISRPPPSVSHHFKMKDVIPKGLQSNMIYKINCSQCDASYIGKTIRHACQRFMNINVNSKKSNRIKPHQTN